MTAEIFEGNIYQTVVLTGIKMVLRLSHKKRMDCPVPTGHQFRRINAFKDGQRGVGMLVYHRIGTLWDISRVAMTSDIKKTSTSITGIGKATYPLSAY